MIGQRTDASKVAVKGKHAMRGRHEWEHNILADSNRVHISCSWHRCEWTRCGGRLSPAVVSKKENKYPLADEDPNLKGSRFEKDESCIPWALPPSIFWCNSPESKAQLLHQHCQVKVSQCLWTYNRSWCVCSSLAHCRGWWDLPSKFVHKTQSLHLQCPPESMAVDNMQR